MRPAAWLHGTPFVMRVIGCLLLLAAAILPVSSCVETAKSREADGSLAWRTDAVHRTLWLEIGDRTRVVDTALLVLCYGWPLFFLAGRVLGGVRRTRRALGLAELISGCVSMTTIWALAASPCWSIYDGASEPQLLIGFYVAIGGMALYALAWPTEKGADAGGAGSSAVS